MAPAVLKAVATECGVDSVALDVNIELIHKIKSHPHSQQLLDFFVYQTVTDDTVDAIQELIDYCTDRILSYCPDRVGLSLLTFECQIFTRWLCVNLKTHRPNLEIVIGGSGVKNFVADNSNHFCQELMQLKLIDHYIIGDGEHALRAYFAGNFDYPGIDSDTWTQTDDLDTFPVPDYSDYRFDLYPLACIPITDSRGCVRKCEFCDVIEHWKKYYYRSAESVFAEMLYQINTHGIKHFSMRNSLTNGNMKEFRKWLAMVVEYNAQHPDSQISWHGYFIVRNAQQHPEEMWQQLALSNAEIHLGVESTIEPIRINMGKKFSNSDIDYHLEQARKHHVPLRLLLMVAYPTETVEHFEFTKQWFRDRLHYAQDSVIGVNLALASVLPGTQLEQRKDQYGLSLGKYPSVWFNQNLAITAQQRQQHLEDLYEICRPFNYSRLGLKKWQQSAAVKVALDHANEVEGKYHAS